MNQSYIKDYDKTIQKFISSWEDDESFVKKSFKVALTGIMVPYIYKIIREEKLVEKEIKGRKYYFSRLKSYKEVLLHLVWYISWSIKWLLLISFRKNQRKIILSAFFPENATSFEYIRIILKKNKIDNYLLLNFNVIYKMEFLLNSKMFCYPHYFYHKKEVLTENLDSLGNEFRVLFQNYFNTDFKFSFTKYLESFSKIYSSFSYLVKKVQRDNKILYFIQDCDYLNDRVLFSNVCKTNNIPTITFDHSIQIYDHLFYNNFSDYRITWGEYQADRIKRLSSNMPKKTVVGGRPGYTFSFNRINLSENKIWVYFLPAFQAPNMQSIYRSLEQSENNISVINRIISENYNNIRLLIKPHPSDEKEIFGAENNITETSFVNLIKDTQLVFTEDSTITLELLNYNLPIIYFSDKQKNEHIHIKEFKIDYVISSAYENLKTNIEEALNKEINMQDRGKLFEYYFGEGDTFEKKLNFLLDEIESK
jgi:hypothetical protein